eukprot:COSAG01_NODE_7566_length_3146_cov_3.682310_2_plen_163_part_00
MSLPAVQFSPRCRPAAAAEMFSACGELVQYLGTANTGARRAGHTWHMPDPPLPERPPPAMPAPRSPFSPVRRIRVDTRSTSEADASFMHAFLPTWRHLAALVHQRAARGRAAHVHGTWWLRARMMTTTGIMVALLLERQIRHTPALAESSPNKSVCCLQLDS